MVRDLPPFSLEAPPVKLDPILNWLASGREVAIAMGPCPR